MKRKTLLSKSRRKEGKEGVILRVNLVADPIVHAASSAGCDLGLRLRSGGGPHRSAAPIPFNTNASTCYDKAEGVISEYWF